MSHDHVVRVQEFVDIMDKSRRKLIKLEKERQKREAKRAKDREKLKKQRAKELKKKGGKVVPLKGKERFDVIGALQKKRTERNEKIDKGNLVWNLFMTLWTMEMMVVVVCCCCF